MKRSIICGIVILLFTTLTSIVENRIGKEYSPRNFPKKRSNSKRNIRREKSSNPSLTRYREIKATVKEREVLGVKERSIRKNMVSKIVFNHLPFLIGDHYKHIVYCRKIDKRRQY